LINVQEDATVPEAPNSLTGREYYHCPIPTSIGSRLVLVWVLLIILPFPAAQAQGNTGNGPVFNFDSEFEKVLAQHGVMGGGFAFVRGQNEARTFSYGEARRESHLRVDGATAYNWASITKTFTAIAILELRDRGQLSLDDPAVRYIPELGQVHDAYGSIGAVTIRHSLTHSAGFRNPTWPWDCDDAANCDWQPFEPTEWTQVEAMLPHRRSCEPAL
jgi:CubicO group peptidase (beta-lactamase class C family)